MLSIGALASLAGDGGEAVQPADKRQVSVAVDRDESERTSGASFRNRRWTVLAEIPRRKDSAGPLRLRGLMCLPVGSKTSSTIYSMIGWDW